MIVAIDGPAGSGKSTIAQKTASKLGFRYLDTGAMYRAIAVRARQLAIGFDEGEKLGRIARDEVVEFGYADDEPLPSRVFIGGEEVTEAIRSPEIDRAVSPVSAHPSVRQALVRRQRDMGAHGDFVVEGRDIGTVVFPDADVKVFLTARPEERARRRTAQNLERGIPCSFDDVLDDIERRDEYDSTRQASPLVQADDAIILDTTMMTIEYVVDRIVALVADAGQSR